MTSFPDPFPRRSIGARALALIFAAICGLYIAGAVIKAIGIVNHMLVHDLDRGERIDFD